MKRPFSFSSLRIFDEAQLVAVEIEGGFEVRDAQHCVEIFHQFVPLVPTACLNRTPSATAWTHLQELK